MFELFKPEFLEHILQNLFLNIESNFDLFNRKVKEANKKFVFCAQVSNIFFFSK